MPPSDVANLKDYFLYTFAVPISDNAAFIEQEDDSSFHTYWVLYLQRSFFRYTQLKFDRDNWEQSLVSFDEKSPGFFERQRGSLFLNGKEYETEDLLSRRRKYMPALVF